MSEIWTEAEYEVTDEIYHRSLARREPDHPALRIQVIAACQTSLPEREAGSLIAHLGNLSAARAELGLPVIRQIAPFPHRPVKLVKFLQRKYAL